MPNNDTGALGIPQGFNNFGNKISPWDMDYEKSPIAEETTHGITILGGTEPSKILPIGRIQEFDSSGGRWERTVAVVREVGVPETEGTVVSQIPGDMGDPSITMNRIELFNGRFEQALGLSENSFVTLLDQTIPFFLVERKRRGNNVIIYEELVYNGCIFTNLSKAGMSVGGDKTILASATIQYVNVIRTHISMWSPSPAVV